MRKSDLFFFLSGAAALIDQVVWARLIGRILGSDASGVTLVLSVFMLGLGVGARLFAPLAAKSRDPVRLFFHLQLGIAAWTAASAFWLAATPPVDGMLARIGFAALSLLPPTLGMGATFPLMGRLTIAESSSTTRATAGFYGANTLGAATGALLAPFVLMPSLGLRGALITGAVCDALAGFLIWRSLRAPERSPVAASKRRTAGFSRVLLVTFLLGFAALSLEVLLTRLFITVTGASIFAFAIVLAVFLTGIGYGSRMAARKDRSELALGRVALVVAPLTLLGLTVLRLYLREDDLFGVLDNRMESGGSIVRLWFAHALWAALALLGPTLALGAALPLVVGSLTRETEDSEATLGRVYAWNTAGSLLGALVTGFWLLPTIGLANGLIVALGTAWLAAMLVPKGRIQERVVATVVAAGLGLFLFRPTPDAAMESRVRVHGAFATASVEETRDAESRETRSLRVNGKVVATTAPVDVRLQRLLGHIPGHIHGEVKRALVIGLGTGMTAGSLLDLPTLERLDIFEISDAVQTCAAEFREWNGNVLEDPRTRVSLVDGRHALARSEDRYDLITSDPIHPWTRGSSDLYSLEHFERMAQHLAPGGIASQWLPLYQLSREDVDTILATWCAAFPHTSAWLTAYDLALVGSNAPLPPLSDFPALFDEARSNLREAGVHSQPELVALHIADDARLRARFGATAPMRDDFPLLEFRAPKSFLAGFSTDTLAWCAQPESLAGLPADSEARGREIRGLLQQFLEELPNGLTSASGNYGERLLALPPLGD